MQILLVEDNPADAELVEEAFRECPFPYQLHFAEDGVAALQFLRRQCRLQATPQALLTIRKRRSAGGSGVGGPGAERESALETR